MAISEAYSGTKTGLSTTEWSLVNDSSTIAAETTDGVYQLFLDLNDMIAGDVVEVRLYEKVLSSGTQRLVELWTLSGAQSKPIWTLPAVILLHGWDFTIKATSGTVDVPYSVRKVA